MKKLFSVLFLSKVRARACQSLCVRMTMLLLLLTMSIGQVWGNDGFYEIYGTYNTGGAATSKAISTDMNLGNVPSFTLTDFYLKVWDDWNSGLCYSGGAFNYRVNNGEAVEVIAPNRTDKNGNNYEFQKTNASIVFATNSGRYTVEIWGKVWGNHDTYLKKDANNNFTWQFNILPPAVTDFVVEHTGDDVIAGSGTSSDPYIVINGGSLKLSATSNKAHEDENSHRNYKFGSEAYSTTNTYTLSSITSASKESINIKARCINTTASLDGEESSTTIYYQAAPAASNTALYDYLNMADATKQGNFKAFNGDEVTANGTGKSKTFTKDGCTLTVSKGAYDKKDNLINAFIKYVNGTTTATLQIASGKMADVTIKYGSYDTSRKLTINGVAQAAPKEKIVDGSVTINNLYTTYFSSVNLSDQSGTLTFGSSSGNIYFAYVEVSNIRDLPTYTVTYAANGGSGTMTDSNSPYVEGAQVTLLSNTFIAPTGKQFASWQVKDASDNIVVVTDGKFTMPASNVTVTAQWEEQGGGDPEPGDCEELVRAVLTSNSAATTTGKQGSFGTTLIKNLNNTQSATIDGDNVTGYKLNSGGAAFAVTLTGSYQAGDVITVAITKANDAYKVDGSNAPIIDLYYGGISNNSFSNPTLLHTIDGVSAAGKYTYTLTAADVAAIGSNKTIGLFRPSSGRTQNQYVYSISVCRPGATPSGYTITYNCDGGATCPEEAAEQTNLPDPLPTLTKDGYTFDGWFTNSDKTIAANAGATLTDDVTLYAKWTEDAPTPGDECTLFAYTTTHVKDATAPTNNASLATNTYGTMTVGQAITAVYSASNTLSTETANYWKFGNNDVAIEIQLASPYKIQVGDIITIVGKTGKSGEARGFSIAKSSVGNIGSAGEILSTPTSSETDYEYSVAVTSEWLGDYNSGTIRIFRESGKTMFLKSITITRPNCGDPDPSTYSITYHCNGAISGCPENEASATTLPSPLPTPVKTGYVFDGWYNNENLEGEPVAAGTTLEDDADLYAKWTANWKFMISKDDYAEHAVSQTGEHTFTFTAEGLAKNTTYYFRMSDGTHAYKLAGNSTMEPNNCTDWNLYVDNGYDCGFHTTVAGDYVFTINDTHVDNDDEYGYRLQVTATYLPFRTVNFNYNDKGGSNYVDYVTPNTPVARPAEPVADGFTFGGWYDNESFTGDPFDFENTNIAEDITLYAEWTQDYYILQAWDNNWQNHRKMVLSDNGYFYHFGVDKNANNRWFKVQKGGTYYGCANTVPGACGTDITNMNTGSWRGSTDDRAAVNENTNNYFIIVLLPNTPMNSTSAPIICASTYLPEIPHNVAKGRTIYYDNSATQWEHVYFRIGRKNHNLAPEMTKVPGTENLYKFYTGDGEGNYYETYYAFNFANNYAWTGDNSIYDVAHSQSSDITDCSAYAKYDIDADYTFSPGESDQDAPHYYPIEKTAGLLTHTITIGSHTNGTIKFTYTDIAGTEHADVTETTAGLAHTCNLVITAEANTGYSLSTLTVNGEAFTSGNTYVLSADAEIVATFTEDEPSGDEVYMYFVSATDAQNNQVANTDIFSGAPKDGSNLSTSFVYGGNTYNTTRRTSNSQFTITFSLPDGWESAELAIIHNNSSREFTLQKNSETIEGTKQANGKDLYQQTFAGLTSGEYQIKNSENIGLVFIALRNTTGDEPACTEPTLTWTTAPANGTDVTADLTLAVNKGESIGAVTYTSSNTAVATIVDGNKLRYIAAGTTTITANLAGDATYCPKSISQTIVVSPTITTLADGYSSFSCKYNVTIPDDLTVYTGHLIPIGDDTYKLRITPIELEEGNILPHHTGVILKGTGKTQYELPITDSPMDLNYNGANDLLPAVDRIDLNQSNFDANTYYVISYKTNATKLCSYTGSYIPARKAYLMLEKQNGAPARIEFDLGTFDPGIITSVEEQTESEMVEKCVRNGRFYILRGNKVFDLNGRVVK